MNMGNKKNMTFEEAMLKLDAAVRRLEGGNMSIDDSLSAYEEAVALIKYCNEKLDAAEQKVRILTEGADGVVTDYPFDGADNEA